MKKQCFFLPYIARFFVSELKKTVCFPLYKPPLKTDFCPSIISFLSFLSVLPIVLPFSTIIYSDSPPLPCPSTRYTDLNYEQNGTNRKSSFQINT